MHCYIVYHVHGNLTQKSGRRISARGAVKHAPAGVEQIQFFLGAGYAHIRKAALFFQILITVKRLISGKYAVLHTGDENDRELQPFGCVQRHKHNGVIIAVVSINIRNQSNILQKIGKVKIFVFLLIADKHCGKFADIIFPVLRGFRILIQIIVITCFFNDLLQQIGKRHTVLQALLKMFDQIRKFTQPARRALGFLKFIRTLAHLKRRYADTC